MSAATHYAVHRQTWAGKFMGRAEETLEEKKYFLVPIGNKTNRLVLTFQNLSVLYSIHKCFTFV